MRLLIVEDNDQLAESLAQGLEADRAALLTEAQDALSVNKYAGVVLDLGLPDGDGQQLVTGLRAKGNATAVLMLTARGTVAEKVRGLSSGADDYLIKPFAFEELIARLRALGLPPTTPNSAIPRCNGSGRLSCHAAPRPPHCTTELPRRK